MFESIEEAKAMDTDQQQPIAQHVQAIFIKAKALSETLNQTRQDEYQKRQQSGATRKPYDFEIPGMDALKERYRDTMAELETEGVSVSELYLSTIQVQKAEIESRLEGLAEYQENLNQKRDELITLESALNNQSVQYSKLLAQGDIAAADLLEEERLGNLQATSNERHEIEHKLAAAVSAEYILKKDIKTFLEMFIKAHRNLLMQRYKLELLPIFKQQFAALEETFIAMNNIIGKIDMHKLESWEHWASIQDLVEKKARDRIYHQHQQEQKYYESLR